MNRHQFLRSALALGASVVSPFCRADASRLRIGLTAVILADQAAFLSRWSEYLSGRLGCQVVFAARESYQEIMDMLFSDQLDVAWICGYPYVLHQPRLRLLAVPLYRHKPLYQSYLIRPAGTQVKVHGWGDLRGKVLAYSDPLSNSGWLVPQVQLTGAGIKPGELKRAFFAHGHRNVAEAVAARLADAGAIDGYVWETMLQQKIPAAAQTEVVWKSDLYGFPPLVVRQSDAHPQTDLLQRLLLGMPLDAGGQSLLRALNLDGFTVSKPALFDSIRVSASAIQARDGAQ